MAEHEEAALFDLIRKLDEFQRLARIGNEQQNIGTPVLDVFFADVELQKVFANLMENQRLLRISFLQHAVYLKDIAPIVLWIMPKDQQEEAK